MQRLRTRRKLGGFQALQVILPGAPKSLKITFGAIPEPHQLLIFLLDDVLVLQDDPGFEPLATTVYRWETSKLSKQRLLI